MLQDISGKRDQILKLAREYGVFNVRIFGSFVRGHTAPDSDIDLLVEMLPRRSLLDLIGFKQDLEDLLGRKVDVVVEGGISPYLEERIRKEAVPL